MPARAVKHDHQWSPVQGERGFYRCSCGEHGRRDIVTGAIGVARARVRIEYTAVPRADIYTLDAEGALCPRRRARIPNE